MYHTRRVSGFWPPGHLQVETRQIREAEVVIASDQQDHGGGLCHYSYSPYGLYREGVDWYVPCCPGLQR